MKNCFKLFLIATGVLGIVSCSSAGITTTIVNNVDFPRNIGYFLCSNLTSRSSCMPMTGSLAANGSVTTPAAHDGNNVAAVEFAYVDHSGHITNMGGCKVVHNGRTIMLGRTNCTVQ